MNANTDTSRGAVWLAALTNNAASLDGYPPSVRVVDAPLAGGPARYSPCCPTRTTVLRVPAREKSVWPRRGSWRARCSKLSMRTARWP